MKPSAKGKRYSEKMLAVISSGDDPLTDHSTLLTPHKEVAESELRLRKSWTACLHKHRLIRVLIKEIPSKPKGGRGKRGKD